MPSWATIQIVLRENLVKPEQRTCLEEAVVRAKRQLAGGLNVVVETPKVLYCSHRDDGTLVLLPSARLVILGTV